jgi:hypothetical protein
MSDEENEVDAAPAADPAAGLAAAMIVLTTIMLLTATITTYKILGDHYHEGMFAKK